MTTHDVPHIAQHLIDKHGLRGWTFRWDNARRRAGRCSYRARVISISRHYARLNVAERSDDVIDTILHEIAHALAGPGTGHGNKWKAACGRIGARPERCYDSNTVMMPVGKLTATCKGCNRVFNRHKRLKRGRRLYCINCGPERGKLNYQCMAQIATAVATQDTPPTPERLR